MSLIFDNNIWFEICDGAKIVETTKDEAKAKRYVFAENSSFRHEKDKTWNVKKRAPKKLENV